MHQIMISAGEASGDMHGASLLNALDQLQVNYQCFGMGGEKLAAAGTELIVDFSDLAVMGYVEVLLNYRRLKQRLQRLQNCLAERQPDILVLIDYASFNLKLADVARQLNIPVLFYISPKIWASRPGRIKKIASCVSHMALIFPFEQEIFKKAGIPATYVGNPLLDQIKVPADKNAARKQLKLIGPTKDAANTDECEQHNMEDKWIGLIPGSRQSEIRYNLPVMLEAALLIQAQQARRCHFILPLADTISRGQLEPIIADAQRTINIKVVEKQSHITMRACDALLVGSGTATLEAAVIGTPMVTLYVMHWLNYMIMRRLVISPFVTLVNIQAGKSVVQELIQDEATAQALADETIRLLEDQPYRSRMLEELSDIQKQMFDDTAVQSVPPETPLAAAATNQPALPQQRVGASQRLASLLTEVLEEHKQVNPH